PKPLLPGLDQPALLYRRLDETREQGMRIERLGLEFRMELHADKPRMVRSLNDFRQHAIGRHARKDEAALLEALAIGVIHLVAMTVALADVVRAIDARNMAVRRQPRLIGAQPHRAAKVGVGAALL